MFVNDTNSSVDWLGLGADGSADTNNTEHSHWSGVAVVGEPLGRRDPLYVVIPMTCVYALILVSGVVGNVSTCIVIARNKHMHTATNYYLFSLAISDLLLLVSGLPPEMYYIWSRFPYVFGEFFCRLTSFAAETSANATVLTITAFTVERYVAICHPFLSYTVSKLSRAVKFIIAIWILALCLAFPQAIQFGIVMGTTINGTPVPGTAQCTLKWEFIRHSFHISTCLFFIAPMTLITVLYVLIGFNLRRSRLLKRPSSTSECDRGSARNQNHVIRMLVAVVVAFFICWAPFHCQRLLAVYASSREPSQPISNAFAIFYFSLTYVSGILYFLSTTINPLLYHTMSNKFRQAFKTTLAQLCSGKGRGDHDRTYSMLMRPALQHHYTHGLTRSSLSCRSTVRDGVTRGRPSVPAIHNPVVEETTLHAPSRLKLFARRSESTNTISNSSLQDVDGGEYTGHELARYMAEVDGR